MIAHVLVHGIPKNNCLFIANVHRLSLMLLNPLGGVDEISREKCLCYIVTEFSYPGHESDNS